jgi:DNA-binding response OmpR family regulator
MAHLQTRSSQIPSSHTRPSRPLVLVVDPDASSRSVLDVALGREGFEVWTAGTASEANLLLTGRAPDLIVLESALGGDDGFTFVAALRGDDRLAKVPVLLLAAPGEENEAALAEVVGVDEIIRKPAFARDVTALARLELTRMSGGPLDFDSQTLPPERMLRALLSTPRSGRMTLAGGRAQLLFRGGKIVSARFGELQPSVDLVERALALTSGEYTVTLMPVAAEVEVNCRLQEVVNIVVPRLARWQRALLKSLPLDMRLAIDFARMKNVKGLPDEVSAVLRLFDGFRNVEQVLLDSPLSASVTLEAATRLFLMGVLTHSHGGDEELFTLRPMPRLFEPPATEAKELMDTLFANGAEIRAPDDAADEDEDWYHPTSVRDELLGDAPGEWTSAPVPEALAAGLSADVQKQLEALGTPMHVQESRESVFVAALRDEPASSIGAAFFVASSAEVTPSIRTPALQPVAALEEVPAVAIVPRSTSADAEAAFFSSSPSVITPAPSVAAEATFFVSNSSEAASSTVLVGDAEATFFATSATETVLPETSEAPAIKTRRPMWPFIAGGVALLAVAALFDLAPTGEPKPEPVVVAPIAKVEDAPVVVEEPIAELEAAPPVDVSENLLLGSQLYDRGEYKKAITVLEQVVSDAPESVNGWLQLGLARYDFGDAKGARAAADKVLTLDAKNGRVQLLLATLHFDANERDLGRAAIQKYLELEPNGAHVEDAKALLR